MDSAFARFIQANVMLWSSCLLHICLLCNRVSKRIDVKLQEQRYHVVVPSESKSTRLDIFLTSALPDFTRTFVAKQCEKGGVLVNKRVQSKHYKVSAGDNITIEVASPEISDVVPEDIKLDILFEDDFILSANKPVGMVVHPAVGSPNGTFANALLYHLGDNATQLLVQPDSGTDDDSTKTQTSLSSEGMDEPQSLLRPGIVHRLDKGTSGVLLAGKTAQAVASLSKLFAARQVRKVYVAVCLGHPGETTIARPIGRSAKYRQQMCTYSGPPGKPAITHVRTICFDGRLSVCLLRIETGRTHQIRVHMKERRTPILGDEVYGTAEWNTRYRRTHQVRRPLLHAYESDFLHPFTGEKISLKAPIPADMASIINKIASHSGMNLEENENLHSGAGYSTVDPVTGLLTCDTYVNEPLLGEQPQLETVGTNTNPQTNKVKGLHPVGQFVPIERVVLREEVWPMGALVTTGDDEEEGEGEHDKDPFVWAD